MGLKANYTRRELLRCLALGGAVVAGGLWIPGARMISIPKEPNIGIGYLELDFDKMRSNLFEGRDLYEGLQWTTMERRQFVAAGRQLGRPEFNRIMAGKLLESAA